MIRPIKVFPIFVLIIFVCVIALIADRWVNAQPRLAKAALEETASEVTAAPVEERLELFLPLPTEPALGSSSNVPDDRISANLIREFDQARDYRVFLQSLLQRGGEGGRLYAMAILSICARVNEKADAFVRPASSREQEAAKQLLASRCGSFSSAEASDSYIYSMTKDRRLANDPLVALQNELGRANQGKDMERRTSLIGRILAMQDPLLLERASLLAVSGDGSVRFDGDELTGSNSPAILIMALQTATCVLGQECGPRHPDVLNYCIFFDRCFPDRQTQNRSWINENFGEEGLKIYERVLPKMEAAIRKKDPSIFR